MTHFITVPLEAKHKKNEFSCGSDLLDNYLRFQANQDIKRKLSACFVLCDVETNLIQGYYTLSNNSIPFDFVPDEIRKKLPKSYSHLPATLLGRLATDVKYQGMGIGRLLLIDALKRSYETSKLIGSFAMVTDPIDLQAESFYLKYGFIKLPDSGKMFLPMKTMKKLFE